MYFLSVIKENYRPFGIRVGDFDIIKDTSTRGCYLFMDAEHAGGKTCEIWLLKEAFVSSSTCGLPRLVKGSVQ